MAEQRDLQGHSRDPRMRRSILERLARWRRVTMSDLQALLPVEERLRFQEQVVEELRSEGLIDMRDVGDEAVLSLTDAGVQWLELHGGQEAR
jgi:hypothetical protein